MAQFASDSFTNTDGTVLTTHSANWTRHTTYTTDCRISDANRVRPNAVGYTLHYRSEVPAAADYDVSADVYVKTFSGVNDQAGTVGRCSTSADTCYIAMIKTWSADELRLYKCVASTFTVLGTSYAVTLATNTAYAVKLTMSGSTIKAHLDGTERISATDSAITDAGRPGIQLGYSTMSTPGNSAGLHIDNFSADQAGIGPLNLSETATISDSGVRNPTKVLTEALTILDALAKTPTKVFTDSVAISDSLSTLISLFLAVSSGVSIADARVLTVQKAISESMTITDLLARTATKVFADSVPIADSISTIKSVVLALIDAITISDALGTVLTPADVEAIVLTVVEKAARKGMVVALTHFPTAYTYNGSDKSGVLNENDGAEAMLDAGYRTTRRAVLLSLRDAFSTVPLKGETVTIGSTVWRISSVAHDRVHVKLDLTTPKS